MTIGNVTGWKLSSHRKYRWRLVEWNENFDEKFFVGLLRKLPFIIFGLLLFLHLVGLDILYVPDFNGSWSDGSLDLRLKDGPYHHVDAPLVNAGAITFLVLLPLALLWAWLMLRSLLRNSRIHNQLSKLDEYLISFTTLGDNQSKLVKCRTVQNFPLSSNRNYIVCFDQTGNIGFISGPTFQNLVFCIGGDTFKAAALRLAREHPNSPYQDFAREQANQRTIAQQKALQVFQKEQQERAQALKEQQDAEARRQAELRKKEEERHRRYDTLEDKDW